MHEVHTTNVLRDFYVEIHKTKKSTQIHSSHFTFLHWVLHLTNYLQIPAKFTAPARCTRNSHGYHHFQFRSIQGEPSSSSSASLASPRLPAPTTSRGSQIHASSPSTRSPPPGNGHRREDRRGLRLRHRHGPLLLRHAPPVGFSALAPLEFGSVWVFARSAMA